MRKTPLYNFHEENGGKLVDFAGWMLPVRYSGLIEEHKATRTSAGLFDVSHMGEITIEGADAEKAINYLCSNDVSKIRDGQAQYSALLNEKGGVVDDLIIYRVASNNYLLCVNASNTEKDFKWILENNKFDVECKNVSKEYGQIALQGPEAENILAKLAPEVSELKTFYFTQSYINDVPVIIARTGYTGEDGFEIFIPWNKTEEITTLLYESGKEKITLCGLGARDTLRLEACYPLHGHELLDSTPAISSGLSWIIKTNKDDFIGCSAIKELQEANNYKRLIGFEVLGAGIVRENTVLYSEDDKKIGIVTSGTKTPTINKTIGMAIVDKGFITPETIVFAEVRGRKIEVEVSKLPFYKRKA